MDRKSIGVRGKVQGKPVQELYESACQARERSYSPYSGHKVGAALRTQDGRVFSGCNIENSSYGGTVCAERTAIFKAVSESSDTMRVAEIVVVTDSAEPWPPCGLCRQVLAEFADPGITVHSANLQGDLKSSRFGDVFPDAFTPEFLKKR